MLLQVAALVFYILCETINKNQFVLNFVVCIVLLAMDFWTVSAAGSPWATADGTDTVPVAAIQHEGCHLAAGAIGFLCAAHTMMCIACKRFGHVGPVVVKHEAYCCECPQQSVVPLVNSAWQVKNVTGRLLVGLRWWNDGNSENGDAWRFESLAEVSASWGCSWPRWIIGPNPDGPSWTPHCCEAVHSVQSPTCNVCRMLGQGPPVGKPQASHRKAADMHAVNCAGPTSDQSVRVTLVLDCAGGKPSGMGAVLLIGAFGPRLG